MSEVIVLVSKEWFVCSVRSVVVVQVRHLSEGEREFCCQFSCFLYTV